MKPVQRLRDAFKSWLKIRNVKNEPSAQRPRAGSATLPHLHWKLTNDNNHLQSGYQSITVNYSDYLEVIELKQWHFFLSFFTVSLHFTIAKFIPNHDDKIMQEPWFQLGKQGVPKRVPTSPVNGVRVILVEETHWESCVPWPSGTHRCFRFLCMDRPWPYWTCIR